MHVERFSLNPLRSNTYVLAESLEPGVPAAIVDPGSADMDPVLAFISEHQLQPVAIWNTHAHFDHVMGVDVLRQAFTIPAYVHRSDEAIWSRMHVSARTWMGVELQPLAEPDIYWQEGDIVQLGDSRWTVWHTPGHSPGGVCLLGESFVLTGDTLFAGTIGRTDFQESNASDMEKSLQRLSTLSDALVIHPGHGPSSTIGQERRQNPFFQ